MMKHLLFSTTSVFLILASQTSAYSEELGELGFKIVKEVQPVSAQKTGPVVGRAKPAVVISPVAKPIAPTIGVEPGSDLVAVSSPSGIEQRASPIEAVGLKGVEQNALDESVIISGINETLSAPDQGVGWFGLGMIDATLGQGWSEGRMAGYIEGKTESGVLIRGRVDTREGDFNDLLSGLGARNVSNDLNRLRQERNFITYGDDSTLVDMAPSSGPVFIDIRDSKKGYHLLWGDFDASSQKGLLSDSSRSLYGLKIDWENPDPARPSGVWAYAANPERAHRQDNILGVGGTQYKLSQRDIVPGTQRLSLVLRDPLSGRIIDSKTLVEGVDYRFNAWQGLVVLSSPLGWNAGPGVQGQVELVADYEYVPSAGSNDNMATGLRAHTQVVKGLDVGVSMSREDKVGQDYEMEGVDARLALGTGVLTGEVAQSRGQFGEVFASFDGGFDATDIGVSTSGRAQAERLTYQGESAFGALDLSYERFDAGFSSGERTVRNEQREIALRLQGDDWQVLARDFNEDLGKSSQDLDIRAARDMSSTMRLSYGVVMVKRSDAQAAENNGKRLSLIGQLDKDFGGERTLYGFAQATVSRSGNIDEDHRVGLGGSLPLGADWTLAGHVSAGSLGPAGDVSVGREDGARYTRIGYKQEVEDAFLDKTGVGSVYVEMGGQITKNTTWKAERRTIFEGAETGNADLIGMGITGISGFDFDATYFEGKITTADEDILRQGMSVGLSVKSEEQSASVRLEYRTDDSSAQNRDKQAYGILADYSYAVDERWRVLGDVSSSVDVLDSGQKSRFSEINIGAAWRDAAVSGVDALMMLSYTDDRPALGRENASGETTGSLRAMVAGVDVNWKATPSWTLGVKIAGRVGETSTQPGVWMKDKTALSIFRADYHVSKSWDIMGEVRGLKDFESGFSRTGGVVAVYRHFNANVKAGVGYQFGDVNDDLRRLSGRKSGAFLNVLMTF